MTIILSSHCSREFFFHSFISEARTHARIHTLGEEHWFSRPFHCNVGKVYLNSWCKMTKQQFWDWMFLKKTFRRFALLLTMEKKNRRDEFQALKWNTSPLLTTSCIVFFFSFMKVFIIDYSHAEKTFCFASPEALNDCNFLHAKSFCIVCELPFIVACFLLSTSGRTHQPLFLNHNFTFQF